MVYRTRVDGGNAYIRVVPEEWGAGEHGVIK